MWARQTWQVGLILLDAAAKLVTGASLFSPVALAASEGAPQLLILTPSSSGTAFLIWQARRSC